MLVDYNGREIRPLLPNAIGEYLSAFFRRKIILDMDKSLSHWGSMLVDEFGHYLDSVGPNSGKTIRWHRMGS